MKPYSLYDLGIPVPTTEEVWKIKDPTQREIASCHRAFAAGMLPALYEALYLCDEKKRPVELWMLRAMRRLMVAVFTGRMGEGPGRTGNAIARFRNDMKHFYRWDMVTMIRRKQTEYREQMDELRKLDLTEEQWRSLDLRNPCRSWEDAYELAAEELRGTPAFGSPATMKRSYQYVERNSRDPQQGPRFKVLSRRTLQLIGIDY